MWAPRGAAPASAADAGDLQRARAVEELHAVAGELKSSERTLEQTKTGLFWAYDGAFKIGTPLRLHATNVDVVVAALQQEGSSELQTGFQLVRLYAMTHAVLADAGIAVCATPSGVLLQPRVVLSYGYPSEYSQQFWTHSVRGY